MIFEDTQFFWCLINKWVREGRVFDCSIYLTQRQDDNFIFLINIGAWRLSDNNKNYYEVFVCLNVIIFKLHNNFYRPINIVFFGEVWKMFSKLQIAQ